MQFCSFTSFLFPVNHHATLHFYLATHGRGPEPVFGNHSMERQHWYSLISKSCADCVLNNRVGGISVSWPTLEPVRKCEKCNLCEASHQITIKCHILIQLLYTRHANRCGTLNYKISQYTFLRCYRIINDDAAPLVTMASLCFIGNLNCWDFTTSHSDL